MINGNTIIFGNGTVAVGSYFYTLNISTIRPPQEIGCSITDDSGVEFLEKISIHMAYEDCVDLQKMLGNISERNRSLNFKGYVFNFEKFNVKSIGVLNKHIGNILSLCLMCMAV